jgi:hypothetical protein
VYSGAAGRCNGKLRERTALSSQRSAFSQTKAIPEVKQVSRRKSSIFAFGEREAANRWILQGIGCKISISFAAPNM